MNVKDTFPATVKAALECAARGWQVFPAKIDAGAKKGCIAGKANGGTRWGATTDPDKIRQYWQQFPESLLGIATGPDSDLFVIDADTAEDHAADGVGTLRGWIAERGDLTHTVEATTPSGGWHLYFRWPGFDVKNSAGKLAPGIDVRAAGGMVIAPPSYRADQGAAYRWQNPPGFFKVVECPEWLLDRIKASQSPKLSEKAMLRIERTFDSAPAGLGEVADLLDHIDPDAGGYIDWHKVLMALHDHTDGGADGLALADQWSARGAKYRAGEVAAKWRSFTPGGGVGIGTIAALARQGGADLRAIGRKHIGGTIRQVSNQPADAPRRNTPDEIDLSHDALAADMGAQGFDLDGRYVSTWGRWLFWTGTNWQVDDRLDHLTRTRAFLRDRAEDLTVWAERKAAVIEAKKGADKADKLRRWAKEQARNLRSKTTVAAVEALARSNPASVARPTDFDAHRLLLGTPVGTVDLRTGDLRPARRDDWITKQTTVAPAPRGSTPARWLQFLNEIFDGDRKVIAFMQRVAGYALTGMTTEHKLFFLYGTGRNGKSVFQNTLFDLWGDYARRAAAETFLNTQGDKHATGIAGLQGARLVAGSELPKGKTWDESVIKDLTGGDRMTARFMRGDFFDFDPHLTLMIAGNTQPSFRGIDEAIRARVVLVPFTVSIPPERRDKALPDKLRAEGPAILRWAIDGALRWQEHGLCVPDRVAAASAEYFDGEDTLGQFLDEETRRDPEAFVTTADLHRRFTQWCECQGLNAWTQHTFRKEMKGRGWQDHRKTHGRGFLGLELR